MRRVALMAALFIAPLSRAQGAGAEPAPARNEEPVQHEFIIRNFRTESGTVLPEAHIVYGTYGKLNAAGDNEFVNQHVAQFLAARLDQPYTQQSPQ